MIIHSEIRTTFLFIIFTFVLFTSSAQTKLDTLLQERTILHKDYHVLKDQKSSFWGSQSKGDLKNIINNLKNIINKDDEIIREINRQNLAEKVEERKSASHKQTDLSLKERNLTNRLSEIKRELEYSNTQLLSKTKEYEKLNKYFQEEKEENNTVERLMAIFFFIIIGLSIYILRLRKRLELLSKNEHVLK